MTVSEAFPDLSPRRQRQIEAFLQEERKAARIEAMNVLIAIPVLVLHDKWGWGTVRITRFLKQVNTWLVAMMQDKHTLAEIVSESKKICDWEMDFD